MECLPNRLTFFNSEIYYKEENYLKVRTAVFKYITPPIVKGLVYWYVGMLAYLYISIFLRSHIPNFIMWLSYPLSYSFTSSISPAFCTLILTQYKSSFSTCTILLIRSVTIRAKREFGTFYKKDKGVLLKIILGNIKKKS